MGTEVSTSQATAPAHLRVLAPGALRLLTTARRVGPSRLSDPTSDVTAPSRALVPLSRPSLSLLVLITKDQVPCGSRIHVSVLCLQLRL